MNELSSMRLLKHFNEISEAPDAVPRLRRFILDLAVRGKLVEQDPDDEPASELLNRIEAEKARLVKAGIIKNQAATSLAKNLNLPFEIPSYWCLLPLHKIGFMSGGMTPSKNRSGFWEGDVNWFSPKDLKVDELVDSELKVTSAAIKETRLQIYPPGSLFMVARSGILKRTFPVSINRVSAACNQDLKVLAPFISDMERYLQIMFRGLCDFIISKLVKTGTTVQSLKYSEFEVQSFPLPPLAEQHRIVAKVDELMALCDELETAQSQRESRRDRLVASSLHRLNNGDAGPEPDGQPTFKESARFYFNHLPKLTVRPGHIKQLRQTILDLAVRGKLVEQDPGDEPASSMIASICKTKKRLIDEKKLKQSRPCDVSIDNTLLQVIPENWAWVKCQDILFVTKLAGFEYSKHINLKESGQIPVVRAQNVRPWVLKKTNLLYIGQHISESLERSALNKPCLLVTFIGAGIGDVALFSESKRWHLAPNVAKLELFDEGNELSLRYLLLFFNSPFGRKEIFKHIKATAQPSLSMGTIRDIDIAVPPLAEQQRIVVKVDELMAFCGELESELTTAMTRRNKLIESSIHQALEVKEVHR